MPNMEVLHGDHQLECIAYTTTVPNLLQCRDYSFVDLCLTRQLQIPALVMKGGHGPAANGIAARA